MKLFTQFLLIGTLIHMGDLKKIALFTNVECPAPYNDLVYDYKCSLVKNAEGVPLLHLSFKLKEDTSNVALHFKVRGKRENQPEETLLVFDLDVCEAISAFHEHFFLKMIFDELRRVSNYPTECPFKKDHAYNIHDFAIDSSVIPPYVPEMSWSLESHYNVSNKRTATFKAYGKFSEA